MIDENCITKRNTEINKQIGGKNGTIYKTTGSLLIISECSKIVPRQFEDSTRSAIDGFSPGSARRMRSYLRECLSEYRYMLTLTYPGFFPANGQSVKEHLRRFCQELKRYQASRGGDPERFSAFWFLEFQERGAPHFHLFLTDQFPAKWIASTWYFIVRSDDHRHLQAGTRIESIRSGHKGIMAYASKYAAKQEQKIAPQGYENVGRFWGVYGRRAVMSAATWVDARAAREGRLAFPLFMLWKQVNLLISDGQIELFKRHEGAAVFTIHTNEARRKVAARICHVAAISLSCDNMFTDAEIDQGESLTQMLANKMADPALTDNGLTIDHLIEIARENRRAKGL
jgi:hypothetical protein